MAFPAEHVRELEKHLLLFFTKQQRTSSDISSSYAHTLKDRKSEQFAMMQLAEAGIEAIKQRRWEELGKLVDQSWRIKSGLSSKVSTNEIDKMYAAARLAGAWGGKITGAGGGGCLVVVAPPEKHSAIRSALACDTVHIPFRFADSGSSIIFADKDNLNAYRIE
jgi:D-glycero-alpha-D-manno-heptose-7-phosphate kinase